MNEFDNHLIIPLQKSRNNDSPIKKANDTYLRFIVLALCTTLMASTYFCVDIPAAFEKEMQEKFRITPSQYGILYSTFHFSNIILSVCVGILVDKIGVRLFIAMFTIIFVAGQVIFTVSIAAASFPLALFGRFIFGIGSGNICIAESALISKWFYGKELSFAMSADTCISRAVNAFALIIFPIMFKKFDSLLPGMYLSVGSVILSLFVAFILITIDKKYEVQDKTNGFQQLSVESDQMTFKDIKLFKADFWAVMGVCGIYYVVYSTFVAFLKNYLERKFNVSTTSFYYSIPYIMGAVLTPIFGYINDKVGKRSLVLIVSGLAFNAGHLMILLLPQGHTNYLIISLVLIGMAYSLMVGSLWSTIPYFVVT